MFKKVIEQPMAMNMAMNDPASMAPEPQVAKKKCDVKMIKN